MYKFRNMLRISLIVCSFCVFGVIGKVYRLPSIQDSNDCDFNGQLIRGVTWWSPPYMMFDQDEISDEIWNNDTESYDISGLTEGIIVDILNVLSLVCNFRFEIHLGREGSEFGNVLEHANGTVEASGMFDYVVKPSAFDMIFAEVGYASNRVKYVDYLPPFTRDRYALVIQNDVTYAMDPWMFSNPFYIEVWICLLILSLAVSGFYCLRDYFLAKELFSWKNLGYRTIQAISSNMGGDFLKDESGKGFQNLALVSFLFLGVMVWNYYQSFIIAGLANRRVQYPFTDLEGLSKSSYFLTTSSSRKSLPGIYFSMPKPGSVEEKIYKNNMDEYHSFIGASKGIDLVHKEPKRAHFAKLTYMKQIRQMLGIPTCDLIYIWKSEKELWMALVTRKDFKHYASLKQLMIKLHQSGQFARFEESYKEKTSAEKCIQEVAPVSMDKLGSIFIILGFAIFLSLCILTIECLKSRQSTPKLESQTPQDPKIET